MVPGIWIAPFLATKLSAVFRERPEWLLRDISGMLVPAGFNPSWDGVFYCLDISLPQVEDHLASLFDTVIEGWGYRYLKLDFLYAGFLKGARKLPGASPSNRTRYRCSKPSGASGDRAARMRRQDDAAPQHFLYFFPEPQGQGSLRPTLGPSRTIVSGMTSPSAKSQAPFFFTKEAFSWWFSRSPSMT